MDAWTSVNLRAWRERTGLSQSEAASALGFHKFHYKNMEYGKREIGDRTRELCLYVEFEAVQGSVARGAKKLGKGVCMTAAPILRRLGSLEKAGALAGEGGRRKLRYLSLFSGLESATAAFERLGGDEAVAVAYCDNGAASQAVLRYRWPDVPVIHDITDFNFAPLRGHVDLVVAGPPCQSYSTAGSRRGLADPRGSLTLHALRAIDALQPRYALIENVTGFRSSNDGEGFKALCGALRELGFVYTWCELDAEAFGLSQRRRRLWLVAERARDASGPEAILDYNQGDGRPDLARGTRWSAPARRNEEVEGEVADGLDWSDPGLWQVADAETDAARSRADQAATALRQAVPYDSAVAVNCRNMTSSATAAPCLQTKSNSLNSNPIVITVRDGERVGRTMTPVECLRLQGLDDDWLDGPELAGKPLSNAARIMLAGNAWPVPCAAWIFAGLLAIHGGDRSHLAWQGWRRSFLPAHLRFDTGSAAGGDGRELSVIIGDGPRSFGELASLLAIVPPLAPSVAA